MRPTFSCLALVGLGGCAVNPAVRYDNADNAQAVIDASAQLIDSYYLQKNELRIELKNTAAKDKPPTFELIVANSKLEDQSRRLMLLRGDHLWARTMINLAKVENTDLIASAGVEVQDRRVELIQTAGSIIKAVVPFVPGVAGPLPIKDCEQFPASPCTLVPTDKLKQMQDAAGSVGQPGGLSLAWGPVSRTAIPSDYFFQHLNGQRSNGLYYSTCRDVVVKYVQPVTSPAKQPAATDTATANVLEWRGKVADPRWVEFVAFPRKGSIRMHAQCGVSTTSEKDPTQPLDTVISTAVTQAIAVNEAVKKANEDDKD